METKKFRCRHCRKVCLVRVKGQKYCSQSICQQARKNAWRREKYASDPEYRLTQKSSNDAWLSSVGGAAAYHRRYRRRKKQNNKAKARNGTGPKIARFSSSAAKERSLFATDGSVQAGGANRDAIIGESRLKPGRYVISPFGANRDVYQATIEIISTC
jgi:hypothetical protein